MGSLEDVKKFWENNPLFTGESSQGMGSIEYFIEHEKIVLADCFAGEFNPIISKFLPSDLNAKILDVGCGPGFWVRYFARKGYKNVFACDLTENAVELTKNSLSLFDLNATVQVGNAESLPFADDTFDYINCQGVIHHTPNTQKCIDEFFRVLKKNGVVVFSVYYQNFILRNRVLTKMVSFVFNKFIGLKGRGRENLIRSGNPDEIVRLYDGQENPVGKSYTKSKILRMVKEAGLEFMELDYFFFPKRAFRFPIPHTLHKWLHRRFGLMICLACRVSK